MADGILKRNSAGAPRDLPLYRESRLWNALDAEVVDRKQAAAMDAVAREARQRRLGHRGNVENIRRTLHDFLQALEDASVIFIDADEEGPGVRLKANQAGQ